MTKQNMQLEISILRSRIMTLEGGVVKVNLESPARIGDAIGIITTTPDYEDYSYEISCKQEVSDEVSDSLYDSYCELEGLVVMIRTPSDFYELLG